MKLRVKRDPWIRRLLALSLAALLTACQTSAAATKQGQLSQDRLQVVATTTILGDVIQQVGGENVKVDVLVPTGTDPHAFQPAPGEVRLISEADLVITSGAGLDAFLDRLLESAVNPGDQTKIVSASQGIEFRQLSAGSEHTSQDLDASQQNEMEIDPHVWFDPLNVQIWTQNIAQALSQADPAHADHYVANAEQYRARLEALDSWIQDEVSQIPPEDRILVTDHQTLGYFADRYGFRVAGVLIPGSSAAAAPLAEDLAALVDAIKARGIQAIFVGSTVSPALAQRVAADTGVRVVPVYTDALTPPGGEASTYLDLMRYDVQAIVGALK